MANEQPISTSTTHTQQHVTNELLEDKNQEEDFGLSDKEDLTILLYFRPYEGCVTQGLVYLVQRLLNPPSRFGFSVHELDEIADGYALNLHELNAADGTYLDNMFESLQWWLGICSSINADIPLEDENKFASAKSEQAHALLATVMAAYIPAVAHTAAFGWLGQSDAHIEFLKQYRLFTRFVCSWVRETWPEATLRLLLQQA